MDFCYFVGIDIAKATLDWAVYHSQQGMVLSLHADNTLKSIKQTLAQLKTLPGWNPAEAVFCMEHTGIYNAHALEVLYESKFNVWLESSLQIKQAGGMQRGKTARRPGDKVDAQRIAQYAYRFRDQMRLWQRPLEVVQKLAFLSTTRQRLNQSYNLLAVPVAEQETFISKTL
ncbi:transposase [Spirosoma oryzae]|uniref:Transposase n=1 Tax=Spirosoma oryzae TaxID=1469603 RepID=A0A2T0RGJ7_9BACT|nr:transposase [Spirosoma oryzae]PRY20288.1 transposase [Spirosoma oryzae]